MFHAKWEKRFDFDFQKCWRHIFENSFSFLNIYKIRTGPGQTSPDCPDGPERPEFGPVRTVSGQ